MAALPLLGLGALVMLALVLLAWVLMLRTGNAAWVDVAWALGMGALALLFAALGPGWRPRRRRSAFRRRNYKLRCRPPRDRRCDRIPRRS